MSRIDLEKAHPIPAPLALWIEPTNVCNFKCVFCPESLPDFSARAGYHQHMKADLWLKIESQLRAIRPKVIRFFHEGEPFLNRALFHMMRQARESCDRIEVTTNGSLLRRDAGRVIQSGCTLVRVSVYGMGPEFQVITGQHGHFTAEDILGNVAILKTVRGTKELPKIVCKLMVPNASDSILDAFHYLYAPFADELEYLDKLHNWGGSLVQIGSVPVRKVCPMPFYTMAIKANGAVSVCCADWDNRLQVGDANTEDLLDIWRGDKFAEIRTAHWCGQRALIPSCRDCTAFYDYPDSLDGHLTPRTE